MGYAGGTTDNPTYQNIGDHAEVVEIDFDPAVISYAELLDVFWDSHNPVYSGAYGQYRSLILFHNDEQKRLAEKTKKQRERAAGAVFSTSIKRLESFTLAEMYHQKYNLQADGRLMSEFSNSYFAEEGLVNSTLAARLNGYIAGYGTIEDLEKEIDCFGLSEEGRQYLLKQVDR